MAKKKSEKSKKSCELCGVVVTTKQIRNLMHLKRVICPACIDKPEQTELRQFLAAKKSLTNYP